MSRIIQPLGDGVLLQLVEEKLTPGGLHIPERARSVQPDAILAEVVAAGPGRVSEYGVVLGPLDVYAGDMVLVTRGAGVPYDGNERVRIVHYDDLLAKVTS